MWRMTTVVTLVMLVAAGTAVGAGPGKRRPSEAAGGRTTTWQSRYRQVKPSEANPEGKIPKKYPYQQNSKTISGPNNGEHRFYDPRTGKEGAKLAKSTEAGRKAARRPDRPQDRRR
jgi:hypothetical protein